MLVSHLCLPRAQNAHGAILCQGTAQAPPA